MNSWPRLKKISTAGHLPICVVANAGTVATGAFDPLPPISEIAQRFNLWLHVDGAYGGFAAFAPSARPLFASIEEADSVALDPHKWLYLPVDCGCILYRDPEAARATFAHEAEYTRVMDRKRTKLLPFGITGRSFHGVFAHSKFGCC